MKECINKMDLRDAGIQDIESLKKLYLQLEQDAVMYQPEHFILGFRNDDFFYHIFDNDNQKIIVAEETNGVIGFAHVMILHQKNIACLKPENVELMIIPR